MPRGKEVNAMEYVKPTLCLTGSAQALVLGSIQGDFDSAPVTTNGRTQPPLLALGLDE
jgi:hypothetical protein